LDSGRSSAIFFAPPPEPAAFVVLALLPVLLLLLLLSLPQAATPTERATAAKPATHLVLRMNTLLQEV
jgi:hypothetical protein